MTIKSGTRKQPIRQVVNVQSNDAEHPTIQLTVTANVLVDIEVVPANLLFTEKQTTAQVKLKNYTDVPIELGELNSTNTDVKVSLSALTIPANGEVVLTGELLPNVPAGLVEGWVKLKSNLKAMPVIEIRVWGNIEK